MNRVCWLMLDSGWTNHQLDPVGGVKIPTGEAGQASCINRVELRRMLGIVVER